MILQYCLRYRPRKYTYLTILSGKSYPKDEVTFDLQIVHAVFGGNYYCKLVAEVMIVQLRFVAL